ncbi:betaine/proline/choline family ABC transporter ATP-binding protein [Aliihoeflea aestuarii]|jgi:glycine betaine/proline transport system ATP-binding protein|uniref:quaternary amine ABC transporter ATP-binding protein n=1 Tax=Aliihoeflea aestuarii TaxID=453840 RepID=UPI002092F006|nr:glycine betaine/L-proline ABC transporter ATP-binding protein [Aliihoeflea aestuarii]MCO6391521.1 betaine/proline/choline family ABC transporter ATP-binding protein [Aliihoeflea aestuarii]
MNIKVEAKSIFKVFGNEPKKALELLSGGKSKEEIFEATGNTIGVQDASFTVGEGQIFVVMGLSGSGKSTLVRMINGLVTPTSGEMLIDGTDVADCSAKTMRDVRRSKIAMVFQHFALFPHMSVADNVAYGLKIKGIGADERRAKAEDALAQVSLRAYADSYPDELSGGMQQRVGLARGLASEAEILLMDEPFSALDPLIRRDMQDELLELQRALKKTIIFITHDLNEALILGDKIAIMKDGRFVQVGTAEDIVANPADDYVAAFTADIDRARVFTAGTVMVPAEALDLAADTAETAMARMETLGRDALHVVEDGRPVGIVAYRDLSASVRKNGGALKGAMIADFPATTRSTQLFDLYGLAETGLPIAITDRKGELVGVVAPQDVFAKLAAPAAA